MSMTTIQAPALAPSALIAVVGSGAMGAGIAQVAAAAGHVVKLFDNRAGAAAKAIEGLRAQFGKLAEKGRMSAEAAQAAGERLRVAEQLSDLADAALVVEAIVESLEAKQKLFRELEGIVGSDCIFGTNTSSISVTSIGAALTHPERLAGLHFFNPAPVMKLVEIVSTVLTGKDVRDTVDDLCAKIGKRPVDCGDQSGFIVNALLVPYLLSAIRMVESGFATAEDADKAMVLGCAHPMGPLRLSDLIGLDTVKAIADKLYEEYKEPLYAAPPLLLRMVEAGYKGKKAGRGFFEYPAK